MVLMFFLFPKFFPTHLYLDLFFIYGFQVGSCRAFVCICLCCALLARARAASGDGRRRSRPSCRPRPRPCSCCRTGWRARPTSAPPCGPPPRLTSPHAPNPGPRRVLDGDAPHWWYQIPISIYIIYHTWLMCKFAHINHVCIYASGWCVFFLYNDHLCICRW